MFMLHNILHNVLNPFVHYAPLGTLISAIAAAVALIVKVRQDKTDLRRKQAEIARQVYNDLHNDEYAMCALLMLDFPDWRYTTKDFKQIPVKFRDVLAALTVRSEIAVPRPDEELLIRRSFDSAFAKLDNIVALSSPSVGLVQWSDFASLFGFYIALMRHPYFKETLVAYAREYGFSTSADVIENPDAYPIPAYRVRDVSVVRASSVEMS